MKVLIVDDDAQNLYLLRAMLETNGYQVETAVHGIDALEKARRDPPALIVSDILMPKMDGFTLCREWQQDERLKGIPFVFYSATYTDPKDQKLALDLGAARFVVKPQEPDVFVEILRQVLKEAKEGRLQTPNPFLDEAAYLQSYSETLVRKLEHKVMQLERAHRRLNALYNASAALTAIQRPEELVSHILGIVIETMGFDCADFFEYDRDHQLFRLSEAVGYTDEELAALRRELVFPLGQERGLVGLVGKRQEPLIVTDTRDEPRWIQATSRIRSVLFVPVIHKGELLGVASLLSTQPDHFAPEDIRNLMALAGSVGIAIENAELVERLTQSEARYRRVVENAPDLIFRYRWAPPRGFEYVSPAATAITGYTPEEHYADPELGWKLIHPDDRPLAKAYFREGGDLKEPLTIRCIRKEGAVIWTELRHVVLSDEAGNPVALEGIIRDVTEREQATQEIRRRAAQQEALNAIIADAARAVDLAGLLETTLDHILRAVNLSRGLIWVEDQHVARGVPAEFTVVLCDAVRARAHEIPFPLVVADWQQMGEQDFLADLRPELARLGAGASVTVPLVNEDEQIGGVTLISAEPRAWKAEEVALMEAVSQQLGGVVQRLRLEEEHRRLSTAVEQAAEAVAITNLDDIIVYVNPAFERITGFRRDEILGRTFEALKSEHRDTEAYRQMQKRVRRGLTWRGQLTSRRKDGSLLVEDSTISPVRNWAGEIVNYVTVMRDVTRELQLEKQFLQAQKMEAVGRLAGGVAHDFNNLLTVIYLSTRLMEKALRPVDPLWEHLQRIREASQRATSLTKQLLVFSRQDITQPQVLDLNALIENLLKMLQRMIGEDVKLHTNLDAGLWPANLDPTQMEQVIMNLAINGRDAMPLGGTLTLETANVHLGKEDAAQHLDVEPGEYVRLSVGDTGVGLSDEAKAHLFEPFFTTKEPGQGTGLGLATVYGVVQQNGGHIAVHSQEGQGTTFEIYLPRANEDKDPIQDKSMAQPAAPLRGTETILLAEDDPDIRHLAVDVLEAEGYRVLTAENGAVALKVGEEYPNPIHLLVTDVVMPEMSGRELVDRLQDKRPEMRILFTSGYTDETITRHGVFTRETRFLSKPFTLESLVAKVRDALDG